MQGYAALVIIPVWSEGAQVCHTCSYTFVDETTLLSVHYVCPTQPPRLSNACCIQMATSSALFSESLQILIEKAQIQTPLFPQQSCDGARVTHGGFPCGSKEHTIRGVELATIRLERIARVVDHLSIFSMAVQQDRPPYALVVYLYQACDWSFHAKSPPKI